MDNFGCLTSSPYLFYFYFVTNLQKKFMAFVRFQFNLHLPPIRASTLLAGAPLYSPSVHTL